MIARNVVTILFQEKETGWTVAFGEMFKCICCPVERESGESKYLSKIADKLDELEASIKEVSTVLLADPGYCVGVLDPRGSLPII